MEFKELAQKAKEIKEKYNELSVKNGGRSWGSAEHTQGFVGDVGDLVKLVMAKNGLRSYDDLDRKIAHELGDCLWSVMVIADDLGIDLEKSFLHTMEELGKRIEKEKKRVQ